MEIRTTQYSLFSHWPLHQKIVDDCSKPSDEGQGPDICDADWNVLLMGPVANEIIEKRVSLWNEKRNGVEGRNWIKVVDSSKTH
jgi:hypothetical protein